MKCVVINLAEHPARWKAMANQFARSPLEVVRFEAVKGQGLSQGQRESLYSPDRNRRQYHQPLTAGEIGCYASHVAVWRALRESPDPCWAVFEDDVELGEALPALLHAVPALSRGWEFLKLIGRENEKIAARQNWISGHRLIRYRRVPSWCSAYVISRRGAERMLTTHIPFGRPVDMDMRCWWESGCQIFGVQPYPVSLAPSSAQSTIGDRKQDLGLAVKLRRVLLRWEYNFNNWRACRAADHSAFPVDSNGLGNCPLVEASSNSA